MTIFASGHYISSLIHLREDAHLLVTSQTCLQTSALSLDNLLNSLVSLYVVKRVRQRLTTRSCHQPSECKLSPNASVIIRYYLADTGLTPNCPTKSPYLPREGTENEKNTSQVPPRCQTITTELYVCQTASPLETCTSIHYKFHLCYIHPACHLLPIANTGRSRTVTRCLLLTSF